jgi:hypothetical protein
MRYIKYTYVDSVTGISIAEAPALNGPAFPAVAGLEFAWARESQYPTAVPEFFGTCPPDSDIAVPGVLGEYVEADWLTMRDDEMRARSKVPQTVTMRQARIALLDAGLLDAVKSSIATMPGTDGERARIDWEYAQEVRRDWPLIAYMSGDLGLTDEQVDALFVAASAI